MEENGGEQQERKGRYKGKHDKPKPWDNPDIDHWKVEKFNPSWNETGMLEVSSFSTLFPQYREKYLQDAWPTVTRALKEHNISCELNLVEGSMSVSTTRKTKDPYIIIKARDLIKLLSRSVPVTQAIKILDDEVHCDIIKIGNIIRSKERFVKRRQRLLGPNGSTLKAIELLTGCYVLVQGNTVAAMGSFKGLKQVRRIAEDCVRNIHPIYHIKELMIKRELAKDPELAGENWDRFLPKFKKRNVKQKKLKKKEKKPYTPFPPPQQPSKIDLQLESGEYFLSDQRKAAKKWHEKQEKQAEKTAENKRKREDAFVPPKESKKSESVPFDVGRPAKVSKEEMEAITASVKKKTKDLGKNKNAADTGAEAYIAAPLQSVHFADGGKAVKHKRKKQKTNLQDNS